MATAEQRNDAREDHSTAAKELTAALAKRDEAPTAERALRELTGAKGDVEYSTVLVTDARSAPLVRRARTLVELAVEIVRLGR